MVSFKLAEKYAISLTDEGVRLRFLNSVGFLTVVLSHVMNLLAQVKTVPSIIRIKDATALSLRGSVGTKYRIHAVFDPARGVLTKAEVTTNKVGETFRSTDVNAGELCLGDKAYGRKRALLRLVEAGAYFLVALSWLHVTLCNEKGEAIDVTALLDNAEKNGIYEEDVYLYENKKRVLQLRLITKKLSPEETEWNKKRIRRNANNHGKKTASEKSLQLAGYLMVATNLPVALIGPTEVFSLYRIRWQIELFFKQCKSILHMDDIRMKRPECIDAFLYAKLIEFALIQLMKTEHVSPLAAPSVASQPVHGKTTHFLPVSPWRLTLLFRSYLLSIVYHNDTVDFTIVKKHLHRLCERPRRRNLDSSRVTTFENRFRDMKELLAKNIS